MRRLCLVLLLACLGGGLAHADTVVGGWSVSDKPDAKGVCLAARSYKDADDDNKQNSVVFGLVKSNAATQMVMVLGYEGWNFDKGEAVVGDLVIDGKSIHKKWKWEGDGKILTAVFDDTDTLIPILGTAKKIIVGFGKDGEANFLIPNAGLALGAAQLCLGGGGTVSAKGDDHVAPCQTPTGHEDLVLANVFLAGDDKSHFDDLHKRSSNEFTLGDPFIIFMQPVGYACAKQNGSYVAKFNVDLTLMYGDQVAVDQKGVFVQDFRSDEPITHVNLNLTDKIGGLVPGNFVIKLKVDDLVGGKSVNATIPLTIVK